MERKLYNIGFGNDLLHMIPKSQAIKEKIDKLDFMKIKNVYVSKDIINRAKRQPKEWKMIFTNHII